MVEINNFCFFLLSVKQTLAEIVSEKDLEIGRIYPSFGDIKKVSLAIAVDVAKMAYEKGIYNVLVPCYIFRSIIRLETVCNLPFEPHDIAG